LFCCYLQQRYKVNTFFWYCQTNTKKNPSFWDGFL
jgi:hypothetical protein